MELKDIKINYIKEDEFLSYIDWLTRFKNPIDNLLRVSEKIITKNCITPNFNTRNVQNFSLFEKIELAKYIWNKSLENFLPNINLKEEKLKDFLLYEEERTFNQKTLSDYIKRLEYKNDLNCNFDYNKTRSNLFFPIDELVKYFENKKISTPFLNRLICKKNSMLNKQNLFNFDGEFASIKLLFIVEGITEEKLFPLFAKQKGFDFSEKGIKLFAAGGKTHILKYYNEIKNLLNIPIFILLDADGKDIIDELKSILLKKDSVYLISKGEIEDILPHSLILKSINNYYSMEALTDENDINKNEPMTKILYNLYKEKGFGDFQKAKFAQIISENINSADDISIETEKILNMILNKKESFYHY